MHWSEWPRERLEQEYSPRLLVPDLKPYVERYAELSAAARAALAAERDLAYGPSPAETLDFFPCRCADAPVHVFIHGGYWRMLGKDDSSFAAPMFVESGAGFVALNYALAPHARLDEIVRQCRAAIAWVYRNISNNVFISGSSAGGHLAAMLLSAGWHDEFDVPRDVVKGGCAISGIFDLEPLLHCSINDTLHLDTAEARRNSPQLLPPVKDARMIVAWAQTETAEWKRQNHEYAALWPKDAAVEIAGRNHYDVVLDLSDRGSRLSRLVLAQMGMAT